MTTGVSGSFSRLPLQRSMAKLLTRYHDLSTSCYSHQHVLAARERVTPGRNSGTAMQLAPSVHVFSDLLLVILQFWILFFIPKCKWLWYS